MHLCGFARGKLFKNVVEDTADVEKAAIAKMARCSNKKEVITPRFVRCHAFCTFIWAANHD